MHLPSSSVRSLVAVSVCLLCLSMLASLCSAYFRPTVSAQEDALLSEDERHHIYLPLLGTPPPPLRATPIWVNNQEPGMHAVGLFRHRFTLSQPMIDGELAIFADTRYEAWLDGEWVGRGPARFTHETREYDIYNLKDLAAGEHSIAVLVQWAPNTRRSESIRPMLQARLNGSVNGQSRTVLTTGSHWRAVAAHAWQQEAELVHAWELIGPTELLDLRQLPPDWQTRAFDDYTWPPAMVQASHTSVSRPRSIPHLAQITTPLQVRDSGLLSPGFQVAELPLATEGQYTADFQTTRETTIVLDTLRQANPARTIDETVQVSLNGNPLTWQALSERHPDRYRAEMMIPAGTHDLTIEGPPGENWTFSLSQEHSELLNWPLWQGLHAGRRLLLSDQESAPGVVQVQSTALDSLNLSFERLPAYVVLDLGRVVHGRFTATITGAEGTLVDVGWDERLWQNTKPLPFPGSLHWHWNQTDSWVLDGTTRSVSNLDGRSGRYILLAVWGDQPVEMRDVRIYEERYPTPQHGQFDSSNDRLDRIWQVGVDTLVANMNDAYADPWRERGQWWGDAYMVHQVNRVIYGDSLVLRRGLLMMADKAREDGTLPPVVPHGGPDTMHDYAMLWVQSLHEYWLITGDTTVTRNVYPMLRGFLGYLQARQDPQSGLFTLPEGHWGTTSLISWATPWCNRYGQSTPLNALYYDTLLDSAALLEALGRIDEANRLQRRAQELREAINTSLYLPAQGRYLGSAGLAETCQPSPQAQAWALAYDVVPATEQQRVADSLLELITNDPIAPGIELYGMYWVLEALARTERIPEAVALIERIYGRLLDDGATTWWEHLSAHLQYNASLSHGWGAAPTWFLTTHVLGAQQTGPATWRVQPGVTGVTQAAGVLPLPDGNLTVEWTYRCAQPFQLEVSPPEQTSGEVVLPVFHESMTLTLNGNPVWQNGQPLDELVTRQDNTLVLALEGGTTSTLESSTVGTCAE